MAKGDSSHTLKVHNLHTPVDPGGTPTIMVFGKLSAVGNYATGGYALDLSSYIPNVQFVLIEPKAGYISQYDYANKKVIVYYADYDASADGALIQVPDNTDIITAYASVSFLAWGY